MKLTEIINQILLDKNLDVSQFAQNCDLQEGPVYKMLRGDTNRMSMKYAKKIHSRYPEYSILFLRGFEKKDNLDNNNGQEPTAEYHGSADDIIVNKVVKKLKPYLDDLAEIKENQERIIKLLAENALDMDEIKDLIEETHTVVVPKK